MKTKHFITSAIIGGTIGMIVGFGASFAYADGPSVPRLDPPVIAPPVIESPIGGFYAGVSYMATTTTKRGTIERSETIQEQWEEPIVDNCEYDGGHSGGKKCTFDEGVDIASIFPDIQPCNGYSKTCDMGGNRVFIKGATGDSYEYDTGETETVFGEEITTFFEEAFKAISEDGKAGGFVGYRHAIGGLVLGAEAGSDGDLTTIEGQAGLALSNNLLAYGFAGMGRFGDIDGTTYGAGVDYVSNGGLLVGLRAMKSDDLEIEQVGFRVGYSF